MLAPDPPRHVASADATMSVAELTAWAPDGVPEVHAGDDLAAIVVAAAGDLRAGDVVVVSSKIVSKAEGRQVQAEDREQAITDETVRVVAVREQPGGGVTRIVENHLGIVGAAAGVDSSNVEPGTVLLLPVDPDASAARLRTALIAASGVAVGVIVTDTLGRPWRRGQTDIAIGAAGVAMVDDLRGTPDANGRPMGVTVVAVADEIASLADLVKGKAERRPIAVVRGVDRYVLDEDGPGARSVVRTSDEDMFRLGSAEAYDDGYSAGYAEGSKESADTADAEIDGGTW